MLLEKAQKVLTVVNIPNRIIRSFVQHTISPQSPKKVAKRNNLCASEFLCGQRHACVEGEMFIRLLALERYGAKDTISTVQQHRRHQRLINSARSLGGCS